MQNLRYAWRGLRRQPLFALAAILTMGLGIGANTAIFSLLHQTLLRPLPYADAERLVFIWNTYPLGGLPQASVSIPDYLDRRTQAPAIEDATLFTMRSLSLSDGGQPEQFRALRVTPSFFSTLGRMPALGRAFTDEEATPGADQFAILTHGLWNARFGADRAVVGREIRVDGVSHRVVGVLPPDFELPGRDVALLVPFSFTPNDVSDNSRGNEFSQMIARLAPGATREQLDAQMKAIVDRTLERLPQRRAFSRSSGFGGMSVPIRDQLVGSLRTPLLVLQAAVLLVLLIACANVANLMLMRASGRGREVAVRSAIGASQGHLIAQLLTEGLLVSALGAAVGLGLGIGGVRALLALAGQQMPASITPDLNLPVLAATLALAVATGLVFGLVPALSTRRADLVDVLREDGVRSSPARRTGLARAGLVVAEVALAVMLLVGAGLLVKSYARLQDVDPGFNAEGVLTAQLTLPATRYPDAVARSAFWQRVVDAAHRIPGVTSAGLTSNVPFNGNVSSGSYSIVGYTPGPTESAPHGRQEVVGGEYFRAMQIPLVAGRVFDQSDGAQSPPVVVIDQYLVQRYFREKDPVGQQIRRGGPTSPLITVVGVVGTINSIDLGQPVTKERLYYPVSQQPRPGMAIVLKTALDPQTLVAQVRAAVQSVDPEVPLADIRTLDQWVGQSLQIRRAPTMVLSIFGGIALLLSAIGIYGVLAFAVAQRAREFGVRQALGADRWTIVGLVMRQGVSTVGLGAAAGVAGAAGLTRFLQSQLFGVGSHDVTVFAGATALLLAVALVACYLPARRATRIDPIEALRQC